MEVLNFLSSPLGILASVVTLYSVHMAVQYSKLRQFPGPLLVGITSLPHSKALLGDTIHLWYASICERYGKVCRIEPNVLVTSSIDLWIHVNKHKGYKRSDWYYKPLRLEYQRDNVFTQTDNEKHEEKRKKMMPGYSGRENHELEHSVDECVSDMLHLIRSSYNSSEDHSIPMDLAPKVQFFTLDVISLVGLGKKFGMLKSDSDVDDYVKSSLDGFYFLRAASGLGITWLTQAPIIGEYLTPSPKDENGFGRMMRFAFKAADERMAKPTDDRSDMLASFIRNGIVGADLRTEVLEQIIAGSDTTAGALRGTILHIVTNPRVYAKLQREIDETVVPDGEIIGFTQAKSLKYLQAVIREGMRCFPPITNFFARDVPPGGDDAPIGNGETVYLPGGTSVGPAVLCFHQNPEIYGEDAKVFRPERWFEPDPHKLEKMKEVSELMFGYGRFKCLGKPVAQIELYKLIFELFKNFDMAVMNPQKPWDVKCFVGLFSITDMWVKVSERKRD